MCAIYKRLFLTLPQKINFRKRSAKKGSTVVLSDSEVNSDTAPTGSRKRKMGRARKRVLASDDSNVEDDQSEQDEQYEQEEEEEEEANSDDSEIVIKKKTRRRKASSSSERSGSESEEKPKKRRRIKHASGSGSGEISIYFSKKSSKHNICLVHIVLHYRQLGFEQIIYLSS